MGLSLKLCCCCVILAMVMGCDFLANRGRESSVLMSSDPKHIADSIDSLEKEKQTSDSPHHIDIKLSLLYALSARIDNGLSYAKRKERRERSIDIVHDLKTQQQQQRPYDIEGEFFLDCLLVQIYAILGDADTARNVLSDITSHYESNAEMVPRLNEARQLLEEALSSGYPFKGMIQPDPFKGSKPLPQTPK